MKIYFAPMEGITDRIYRSLHRKYFGAVSGYFAPFLSPTHDGFFTPKDLNEISTDGKPEPLLTPQLLTKSADDFLWASDVIANLGYTEVNLNLGCPSGTVVAKGKGSGMLADTAALDAFLYRIFNGCRLQISVKTRIGVYGTDEFPAILRALNKYPIKELTVHPRTQKEMYRGTAHIEAFEYCYSNTSLPLCYNGDVRSAERIAEIEAEFPKVNAVMLGRGLASEPWMFCQNVSRSEIYSFTCELSDAYASAWGSDKKVLPRMKENWMMMITSFAGSEKYAKRLSRSQTVTELKSVVSSVLTDLRFK